jgi:hypothetical protein
MWQMRIDRFGALFEAGVLGFGLLWVLWALVV